MRGNSRRIGAVRGLALSVPSGRRRAVAGLADPFSDRVPWSEPISVAEYAMLTDAWRNAARRAAAGSAQPSDRRRAVAGPADPFSDRAPWGDPLTTAFRNAMSAARSRDGARNAMSGAAVGDDSRSPSPTASAVEYAEAEEREAAEREVVVDDSRSPSRGSMRGTAVGHDAAAGPASGAAYSRVRSPPRGSRSRSRSSALLLPPTRWFDTGGMDAADGPASVAAVVPQAPALLLPPTRWFDTGGVDTAAGPSRLARRLAPAIPHGFYIVHCGDCRFCRG